MLIQILLTLTAVLFFLFLFWKRLKDDYIESIIFTSGFYIIFGIGLGVVASYYLASDWWFWFAFLGEIAAVIIAIIRYKMRVFEVVEAAVLATLPLVALVFVHEFLTSRNIYNLAAAGIILLLIIIFFYLDKHYKEYTWYKSGKIGFSGLTVLGMFFLIRAGVALISNDMISFLRSYDAVISGILSFISFFAVYNLARIKS